MLLKRTLPKPWQWATLSLLCVCFQLVPHVHPGSAVFMRHVVCMPGSKAKKQPLSLGILLSWQKRRRQTTLASESLCSEVTRITSTRHTVQPDGYGPGRRILLQGELREGALQRGKLDYLVE